MFYLLFLRYLIELQGEKGETDLWNSELHISGNTIK